MVSKLKLHEDIKQELEKEYALLLECARHYKEKKEVLDHNFDKEWNLAQVSLLKKQIKTLRKDLEKGRNDAKNLFYFYSLFENLKTVKEDDIEKIRLSRNKENATTETWLLEMDTYLFNVILEFYYSIKRLDLLYNNQIKSFPAQKEVLDIFPKECVGLRMSVAQYEKPLLKECFEKYKAIQQQLKKVIDEIIIEEGTSKKIVKLKCDLHFHPNLDLKDDEKARARARKWWAAIKKRGLDVIVVTEHMYKNPERVYDILNETRPDDPDLMNVELFPGMEYLTSEVAEIIMFSNETGFNWEYVRDEIRKGVIYEFENKLRQLVKDYEIKGRPLNENEISKLRGEIISKKEINKLIEQRRRKLRKYMKKERNISLYIDSDPLYKKAMLHEVRGIKAKEVIDFAKSRGYATYLPHPYYPKYYGGVDAFGRQRILQLKQSKESVVTREELLALGIDEFPKVIPKNKKVPDVRIFNHNIGLLMNIIGEKKIKELLNFYLVYQDEKYQLKLDDKNKKFVAKHSSLIGLTEQEFSIFLKKIFDYCMQLGKKRYEKLLENEKPEKQDINVLGALVLVKIVRSRKIGVSSYNDAVGEVNKILNIFTKKKMKTVVTPESLLDDAQPSFIGGGTDSHLPASLGAYLEITLIPKGDLPTRDEIFKALINNKSTNWVSPKFNFKRILSKFGAMWIGFKEYKIEWKLEDKRFNKIEKAQEKIRKELRKRKADVKEIIKIIKSIPDREAYTYIFKKFTPKEKERIKSLLEFKSLSFKVKREKKNLLRWDLLKRRKI